MLALRNILSQYSAGRMRRLNLCDRDVASNQEGTNMKRIVTHLLVAAGLAAGVCGVAQAHGNVGIGISLGTPAPVYAAPQPVYYSHWNHGGNRYRHDWNRGDDHRWEYRDRDHRSWDHGRTWGNWRD
jgi:hypothetical protein